MSYLLQLIKANALGDAPCSLPQEIIPGDLILNKRHFLPMSSISTYFINFIAFSPFTIIVQVIKP